MEHALAQLAAAGFDLAHAFDTQLAPQITGGRLGILIGNTRAVWPHFRAALPSLPREDPLECYTERTIDAAFAGARIYYAHHKYEGAFIPFQRIAVASGFGALAPSRLVVHPIYGPWFALRAVVVLDGEPPVRTPITQPCTCAAECTVALDAALADPFNWRAWLGVRDACTLRDARYTDEQIAYHYTNTFARQASHDREPSPPNGELPPAKPR